MAGKVQRAARPGYGLAEKRRAILNAARKVFGRVGYLGASIEVISNEAGVSTRTIYNHFENKEELFSVVLIESSSQVAEAREELIDRHLGDVGDLESALTGLAKEWVRPKPEFVDHFTLVRRLRSEPESLSPQLRTAWREAGPLRARRALAERMTELAQQRLLRVEDPDIAAQHFMALITDTSISRSEFSATALDSEIDRMATFGVRTFLYGYRCPDS